MSTFKPIKTWGFFSYFCEWHNFCGVPVFMAFVEGPIHNSSIHKIEIFCRIYKGKSHGQEPNKCVVFDQSMKIGIHEN